MTNPFLYFRRRRERASRRVAAAVSEHARFEAEHVTRMTALLAKAKIARPDYRLIPISENENLERKFGEYDRDQRLDRVEGEVLRLYYSEGKRAPGYIRRLVEQAL